MARWVHKKANIPELEDSISIPHEKETKIWYSSEITPIRFIVVVIPIEGSKFGVFVRLFPSYYLPIRLKIGNRITLERLNFKDTYIFKPVIIKSGLNVTLSYVEYIHFEKLKELQGRHPDYIDEGTEGGKYLYLEGKNADKPD